MTPERPTTAGELIGAIYDAALDQGRWQGVVAALTTWIGGVTGGLQVRRLQPTVSISLVSTGLDPVFERAYREHYYQCDPHLARVACMTQGQTLLSREVLADDELFATPFFNEFCSPQDLCDVQGAVLLRDDTLVATFAAYCSGARRFDELSRARLDAVVPHLARALNIARVTEARAAAEFAWTAAAETGRAGLLRVDEALRVLAISSGVEGWLADAAGPLAIRDGHLRLRDGRDEETLRAMVREACCGARPPRELTTRSDPPLAFIISRVPAALTRAEPAAMVMFWVGVSRRSSAASFKELPAALRPVAGAIASGLSDKEIAAQLDIPLTTCRTYVTRTLRRLGMRSRRELIVRQAER